MSAWSRERCFVRLFFAIELSDETRQAIARAIDAIGIRNRRDAVALAERVLVSRARDDEKRQTA